MLRTKNFIDVCPEEACLTSSSTEKILGIKTDSILKYDEHVSDLCDKVSTKSNALCRIAGYMSHSRILNNKTYRLHERTQL